MTGRLGEDWLFGRGTKVALASTFLGFSVCDSPHSRERREGGGRISDSHLPFGSRRARLERR